MSGNKEDIYSPEAERLYVHEGKNPKQIVELLHGSVSENSIYKWLKKGDWVAKRRVALTGPRSLADKMRRNLERQIEAQEAENRIDAGAYDAIYKAFCAIEKLEMKVNLRAAAIEVLGQYGEFLRGRELAPGELQMHSSRMAEFFRSLE